MKKLLMALILALPAISGWSLKGSNPNPLLTFTNSPSGGMFSSFNAHREGHATICLMWKMSTDAGVASYQIEKSYDGEFFDPVAGQVNNHGPIYTWKDSNVFPGYIYYRVAANMANGDVIYSDVQVVHIVQH